MRGDSIEADETAGDDDYCNISKEDIATMATVVRPYLISEFVENPMRSDVIYSSRVYDDLEADLKELDTRCTMNSIIFGIALRRMSFVEPFWSNGTNAGRRYKIQTDKLSA